MLKQNYLARLKVLFFEKGISSQKSRHLLEELEDHLILQAADLKTCGHNAEEAERLAIESVGLPEAIAEKARAELHINSWLLRWAWLTCGAGIFIASFLVVFAINFLGYYFSGDYQYDNGGSMPSIPILLVEVFLFNWLPLLIGMGALVLLIRFSSVGWISVFVAAIALGIAVSGGHLSFSVSSVAITNQLCFLRVDGTEFFQCLYGLPGVSEPTPVSLVKLFTPLGVCLFARYLNLHVFGPVPLAS
jgi:hypothetical protein